MEHPSGIPDKVVKKVVARRGRLHAFERIEGARTTLVVIDLDEATREVIELRRSHHDGHDDTKVAVGPQEVFLRVHRVIVFIVNPGRRRVQRG